MAQTSLLFASSPNKREKLGKLTTYRDIEHFAGSQRLKGHKSLQDQAQKAGARIGLEWRTRSKKWHYFVEHGGRTRYFSRVSEARKHLNGLARASVSSSPKRHRKATGKGSKRARYDAKGRRLDAQGRPLIQITAHTRPMGKLPKRDDDGRWVKKKGK